MKPLRIGTRQSKLALWQSQFIFDQLKTLHPEREIELVHFTTQGDKVLDKPLPEIGGKGLFTLELEHALQAGEIDVAVHSLKDLPTQMTDFVVGAIPVRATPFDALVSNYAFADLPQGAVIGTSSLRRAAQLKNYRPDFQIKPIRGNVETRIHKTLSPETDYDATILAVAGLERLGRTEVIREIFDVELMLPAPGQGAIAVQCRASDDEILGLVQAIDHAETRARVTSERAFLQQLEAGCSLPVSAYATLENGALHLVGRVNSVDGTQTITVRGDAPIENSFTLGVALAEQALAEGARALLTS